MEFKYWTQSRVWNLTIRVTVLVMCTYESKRTHTHSKSIDERVMDRNLVKLDINQKESE